MALSLQFVGLMATSLYQAIACWREDRTPPPGQLVDVGGYRLHFWVVDRSGSDRPRMPTIVLEHSLGGSEGYLLLEELSKLGRVCIYDRAGYGWSDHSPYARTSDRIVTELDALLTKAKIEPPYLLVGDSFGSYNVRLYAHRFPDKVAGMVLTDGLHETAMLKMPLPLQSLKLFFISGFVMSVLGAAVGVIRLLKDCGIFELLKPELRQFSQRSLKPVKRSFCRPKHWTTMSREMLNLENSARQVQVAKRFGEIPIASIKANSFFKPALWTWLIPLKGANRLRDRMHLELCQLSTNCIQLDAEKSGHFVWVDQPEVMIDAVKKVLDQIK